MIMPIDIDKKEFTRDKRGYNSREVDEFLDLIIVDYEKVLNDNRNMAHKIKFLEKQLEESQKSDTAMLDTLETAKKLMADISASAERRAELMMRDAELEAENMVLEAKTTVKKLNDEHLVLKQKVERLRANYKMMLETELKKMENDEYDLLPDLDRSDIPDIDKELGGSEKKSEEAAMSRDTIVVKDDEAGSTENTAAPDKSEDDIKPGEATVSDLSESLRTLAEDPDKIDDTIILK
jgi:cell division initiation protein